MEPGPEQQFINQKMRPGSGVLSVQVLPDGPTRVLQVRSRSDRISIKISLQSWRWPSLVLLNSWSLSTNFSGFRCCFQISDFNQRRMIRNSASSDSDVKKTEPEQELEVQNPFTASTHYRPSTDTSTLLYRLFPTWHYMTWCPNLIICGFCWVTWFIRPELSDSGSFRPDQMESNFWKSQWNQKWKHLIESSFERPVWFCLFRDQQMYLDDLDLIWPQWPLVISAFTWTGAGQPGGGCGCVFGQQGSWGTGFHYTVGGWRPLHPHHCQRGAGAEHPSHPGEINIIQGRLTSSRWD